MFVRNLAKEIGRERKKGRKLSFDDYLVLGHKVLQRMRAGEENDKERHF